jgi:hypothetical protein
VLEQLDGKVAGCAAYRLDFTEGFQFDVQVPADLDQFR